MLAMYGNAYVGCLLAYSVNKIAFNRLRLSLNGHDWTITERIARLLANRVHTNPQNLVLECS